MRFKVKKFSKLSNEELYDILRLRAEIFVVEQQCVYQDMDGVDKRSLHLFGSAGNEIVAYARIIPAGITYKTASIGRVVVAQKHRGKKHAYKLMDKAVKVIRKKFRTDEITISAQLYLKEFYANAGFKAEGKKYLEDNIPHIKMRYHISQNKTP